MHMKNSFLFILILSLTFFACSNKEDNEEPAQKMLDEALSLQQAGKDDKANIILQDIIRKYPKTQIAIELNKKPLANKEEAKRSNWIYGESKDEMSGKVSKHATNASVNTVNFDFPYQGVQHGTIMVTENGVLFYVRKGQVICHGGTEYGTCIVRVKFDDGNERYVKAEKLGDDSTTIRFTEPGFLENLKGSKKLMIQVEVYHNGYPVFTFDVGGLI